MEDKIVKDKIAVKTTVAEQLVEWLHAQGIGHVFGTPSGGWLPYMRAMKSGGVEFVLVSHEGAAGFMACGYAIAKGVPGACYATIGPGATNLATGVGGAYLNRLPMLAFTTEAPGDLIGRTVQMAIDQQTLFKPLTKKTTRLEPERMVEILQDAFTQATSEVPGPVHIGLPDDLSGVSVNRNGAPPAGTTTEIPAAPADTLREMDALFQAARRPILAIGLGAVRSRSADLIRTIAERHSVPVILTPMAKGMLAEDHPAYTGVLFHALSDIVAETHREADLVVGVGYDPVEFNYESWMPPVRLLHVDVKEADIDRGEYPNVTNVIGAIPPALERLAALDPMPSEWDFSKLRERRDRMFSHFEPQSDKFGPIAALAILRKHLPEDGIMTCDVGAHTHLIGQMWRTPAPGLQIMDNGWSSMGFGVPSAIGAKLAAPEKEVVCVTGDGGFLMMAGEMATAKRIGHRIVFVMLCDNSLDLIRIKQDRRKHERYGTELGPELSNKYDDMFGVPVIKAKDERSYDSALKEAFSWDGPVIVQAFIDPSDYDGLILRKHK